MKKLNPLKLLFGLLGLTTLACTAGAVSGTLAWYAYITRATLSYSGTSVNSTTQLQIGICSDDQVADMPNTIEEVTYEGDSHYYYFAKAGAGLTSSVISTYLEAAGYATNTLQAVTSGYYDPTDATCDFALKKSPNEIVHGNTTPAKETQYVHLPLVFRILKTDTPTEDDFVSDAELWLTKATAKASSNEATDGIVYKALRVFVDRTNDYDTDFIFNPSALDTDTTLETKVGGALDLSGDEYYDFDLSGEEIIYGEYTTIGGMSATGWAGSDTTFFDLNGTGITNRRTTFTAKHYHGIKYYENLNSCVFKTAKYESLSTLAPSRSGSGDLENVDSAHPTSVCKTADETDHYLGRVTLDIYLEGWDHAVIDDEINHKFDLGLTFEINKVNV